MKMQLLNEIRSSGERVGVKREGERVVVRREGKRVAEARGLWRRVVG
jgi:hypothetical protein